jgi:hypothetical protein
MPCCNIASCNTDTYFVDKYDLMLHLVQDHSEDELSINVFNLNSLIDALESEPNKTRDHYAIRALKDDLKAFRRALRILEKLNVDDKFTY